MAANRPYGQFYDFYSVSPEYFGYHHVYTLTDLWTILLEAQKEVEEEASAFS
jgi:hypothetical protein